MSTSRAQDFKSRIEKATAGHYYIYVSKNNDKFRTSQLRLSGAEKMFEKHPDFIYCSSLRICGSQAVVHDYLVSPPNRFEESQVTNFLKHSYSVSCSPSLKAEMQAEIERDNSSVSRSSLSRGNLTLGSIISLGNAVSENKKNQRVAAAAAPATPKPAAPKATQKDLKSRVAALPKDKVLDVTGFDATKNTGIKTVNASSRSVKRPLAASEKSDLHRVVFDFSKDKSIAVSALMTFGYSEEKATSLVNNAAKAATSTVDLNKIATVSPKKKN